MQASIEEEPEPGQRPAIMRSQTVKMDPTSYSSEPQGRVNRSHTTGGPMSGAMGFGNVVSIKSEPTLGGGSRLDSDDAEVTRVRQKDDDPVLTKWQFEDTTGDIDLARIRESFIAVQAQLSNDKAQIRLLEGKLEGDFMELFSKINAASEERRVQSMKFLALEKRMEELEIEAHESSKAILGFREQSVQGETLKAMKENVRDMQDQVNELNVQVAQAASAEVIGARIDSMSQKIEILVDTSQKAETERSAVRETMVELQAKVSACTEKVKNTASQAEMDSRWNQLDQQCRGVTDLMIDVQSTLGDISTAVVALGSKAEKSELVSMRGELSAIAAMLKEREQTVLFGARCLSCNRVFDDVRPDCGSVDLPGERQRDALFSEVQRALHSPKMDPTAKIKMLAVKVGRPTSVPSGSGAPFAGRDACTFSCGVGDVQLVPVRGNAIASDDARPPSKPEGTPRMDMTRQGSGWKRRLKPAESTWQGGTKEGPLDFKHPLSQLVDRSNRFLNTVS